MNGKKEGTSLTALPKLKKKIIREYYENLYACRLDNLDKMEIP